MAKIIIDLDDITNGKVIKTLFPKLRMYSVFDYWKVDFGGIMVTFDREWWNAPYKGGSNGKAYIDR